jgi:hypothetical protein
MLRDAEILLSNDVLLMMRSCLLYNVDEWRDKWWVWMMSDDEIYPIYKWWVCWVKFVYCVNFDDV